MYPLHILSDIASGSHSAFKELYDLYSRQVFNIAYKLLHSKSEAEEMVQEIFLKLWQIRTRLPKIENFDAFLTVMVRNKIYNQLQKKSKISLLYVNLHEDSAGYSNCNTAEQNTAEQKELIFKLQQAIAQLPQQQKKVIELSRFEEKSHDEIAQLLGISKETVKKHIMAGLQKLKKVLAWVSILFF